MTKIEIPTDWGNAAALMDPEVAKYFHAAILSYAESGDIPDEVTDCCNLDYNSCVAAMAFWLAKPLLDVQLKAEALEMSLRQARPLLTGQLEGKENEG